MPNSPRPLEPRGGHHVCLQAQQRRSPANDSILPSISAPPPAGRLRTADGAIASGTVSFRPSRYDGGGIRYLRFRAWLDSMAQDAAGIGVVHYEEVRRHVGTDAAHVYGGLLATLTAWCEQNAIRLPGRPRRHDQAVHRRQGQRRQGRRSSPPSASAGSVPPTTTRPTRIAILLWAIETDGGVR